MSDTSKAIQANTKFTSENIPILSDQICELISLGWGLQQALDSNEDFPKARTFYQWLETFEDVAHKYARARDRQQDYEADNIIEIADTEKDAQKARNRIDARKWRASKLAAKKYGDRLDLNVAGKLDTLNEQQLDAKLALLLKEAGIAQGLGGKEAADLPDAPSEIQALPKAD